MMRGGKMCGREIGREEYEERLLQLELIVKEEDEGGDVIDDVDDNDDDDDDDDDMGDDDDNIDSMDDIDDDVNDDADVNVNIDVNDDVSNVKIIVSGSDVGLNDDTMDDVINNTVDDMTSHLASSHITISSQDSSQNNTSTHVTTSHVTTSHVTNPRAHRAHLLPPAPPSAISALLELSISRPHSSSWISLSPPRGHHSSPRGHNHPLFIVDSMMGRLARKLRTCGLDASYIVSNDRHDILKAVLLGNRTLLTQGRMATWLSRRLCPGQCYCVESKQPHAQLLEVIKQFDLKIEQSDLFTRCIGCNASDFVRIDRKDIEEMAGNVVPIKVVAKVNEFFMCAECAKIYWAGRHLTTEVDELLRVRE